MKTVLGLSLLGLILLVAGILSYQAPQIAIVNHSGHAVEELRISVGETPVVSASLGSGGLDRHSLPLRHEGSVRLQIRFSGGIEREFEAGWFNPGQSSGEFIEIVSVDSIRIQHRPTAH